MKSYLVFSLIVSLALFGLHCGIGGNSNPIGVTGGSSDGYGAKNFGASEPGPGPNPGTNGELYGTWIAIDYDYGYTEILTINPDGTYELQLTMDYYSFSISGYFTVEGNQLYIDGEPVSYSLSGNTLILDMFGYGYPIVFTRIDYSV